MAETCAAQLDANGDVVQVIVIPSGEDAPTYCQSLDLPGTWENCPRLPGKGWRYVPDHADYFPHWQQIAGAGTGPEDAESGYSTGSELFHEGHVYVSRVDFNVGEPFSDGTPTTWSRKDGTYVTPAGWQYDVGEEVQEDGTWYRVTQATAFAPSASPSQYDEITGPGGEVVEPGQPISGDAPEWAAGLSVSVGEQYTYQGATYEVVQAHTTLVGWEPPNVPSLWAAV